MKFEYKSKLCICLLAFVLFSISFLPNFGKKASAQWFVVDLVQQLKEMGLDGLATVLREEAVRRVTQSTVNWINSGFEGNPAFVTNPGQFFGNIADGVAGQIIYNTPSAQFMCGPIRAKVQIALTKTYSNYGNQNFQCTLTGVAANFDNFIGDFNQGGWDSFIQITQNSQNNPLGLYNSWNDSVLNQINNAVQVKKDDLDRGNGFLSYQKCEDLDEAGYNQCRLDGTSASVCLEIYKACEVSTPGSVINGQLTKVLGSGMESLNAADEINEVLTALVNQLLQKSLGAAGIR